MKAVLVSALVGFASADLRWASQPKEKWVTQQRSKETPFRQKFSLYMEPSDFNYAGLKQQRDGGGYDNFLRSNIDNEQDRRNFDVEPGKDHLPFRSFDGAANDVGVTGANTVLTKMAAASTAEVADGKAAGNFIEVVAGEPYVVPLRWNNPHSAELEVNIWIMNQPGGAYVVPIMKPTCSGEGYQDNVFTFIVPTNFNQVASCRVVGDCVLQVYAHSVESRMYSSGTPIVVTGGTGVAIANAMDAKVDKALNLTELRRLCLPRSANNASHNTAVVYKARLSSDVYNHAYQNSDFSPYAGQQPDLISQNLQASCILKMTVGNFGELGKTYMQKVAPEARQYADKLDKKARELIRSYEVIADSIIEAIAFETKNSDMLPFVARPTTHTVNCSVWRDNYTPQNKEGRVRGRDYTEGWCRTGFTCLCKQDCVGDGDAYCAKLDATTFKVVDSTAEARLAGKYVPQMTTTTFRAAEAGSTDQGRQNTNTYIPSFELQGASIVNDALQYVAPIYLKSGFMTNPDTGAITKKDDPKAIIQIYMAVLTEMWPEFKNVSNGAYLELYYPNTFKKLKTPEALNAYRFSYRGPVLKDTLATLSDDNAGKSTQFRKVDAAGNKDGGFYASSKAWPLQAFGKSSTAIPQTQVGPLLAGYIPGKIPETNLANFQGTVALPVAFTGTSAKLPPDPVPSGCGVVAAGFEVSALGATPMSPEQMDGLLGDYDCEKEGFQALWQGWMKGWRDACNKVVVETECDDVLAQFLPGLENTASLTKRGVTALACGWIPPREGVAGTCNFKDDPWLKGACLKPVGLIPGQLFPGQPTDINMMGPAYSTVPSTALFILSAVLGVLAL